MPSPSSLKTVFSHVVCPLYLHLPFQLPRKEFSDLDSTFSILDAFSKPPSASHSRHSATANHPHNLVPANFYFTLAVGWGNTPIEPAFGSAGSRDDASVKSKMINLISSVRTLMRSMLVFVTVVFSACILVDTLFISSTIVSFRLTPKTIYPYSPCETTTFHS